MTKTHYIRFVLDQHA